jgi:hypothetical protein
MHWHGLTLEPCLIARQIPQRPCTLARLIALPSAGQRACIAQLRACRMTIGTGTAEKQQIAHRGTSSIGCRMMDRAA